MALQQARNTRLPLLVICTACLIACCAVVSLVSRRAANPVTLEPSFPLVSVVRTIEVPGFVSARFALASNTLLVRRIDGTLDAFSNSGEKLFSVQLPPDCEAVPSVDNQCLMTYYKRNPAEQTVRFLDLNGRRIWQMKVDGAVWCADSCAGDEGARFVLGTGEGLVYVVDIGSRTRRYRRWRMPGAVVSVAADPRGRYLIAASWHRSSVVKASLKGVKLWETQCEPAALHNVRLVPGSSRGFVEATAGKNGENGSYAMLGNAGRTVLAGELNVKEDTHVFAAPGGRFVCCGVTRLITHQGGSMWERHAILMDSSGKALWEKGSPFFQAIPAAVTSKGYVLVSDGKNSMFIVSPSGEMQASVKLPWSVKSCVASADSSRLLASCRNGKLVLMEVSQ